MLLLTTMDFKMRAVFQAGVDEAGRGPLAGPVTAACVCLAADFVEPRVRDSKQLSAKEREELVPIIEQSALAYAVVSVGPRRIEQLNIREATRLAMRLAAVKVFRQLRLQLGQEDFQVCYLIDGNMEMANLNFYLPDTFISQQTIIKGDTFVPEISAASILAKVARDALMKKLDFYYPGYDFAKHQGYPTKTHCERIKLLRPSRVHRATFKGVKEFI